MKQTFNVEADRVRLLKACCTRRKFAGIDGAPLPTTVADVCCEVR